MVRVLVVEDDRDLRTAVSTALRSEALAVDESGDMASADEALFVNAYDCVVFDRLVPARPGSVDTKTDSIEYVRRQRQEGWTVPVLFMTALDTGAEEIRGFEYGGDDYVVKPFSMQVLVARVLSLCRRSGSGRPPVLRYDDLEVDSARREVRRDGVLLTLRLKEFAVLEYMISRPEQVVTRTELIDHCWDGDADPSSNVVDVTIGRLRSKMGEPLLIQTVHGHGYRLGQH